VELTIKWRKTRSRAELVEIADELERHARYALTFLTSEGISSSNPFLTRPACEALPRPRTKTSWGEVRSGEQGELGEIHTL